MDKYLLSNGLPIDMDGLVDAVLSKKLNGTEYPLYFLDTKKGDVCVIETPEALKSLVEKIGESTRYLSPEILEDSDYDQIIKDYIEIILNFMANKKLVNSAMKALVKGGWRAVENELAKNKEDDWTDGWDQFLRDSVYESVVDFVMNLPGAPVKEVFEGCDDCDICQAMKEGKANTPEELIKLFEDAEKKGVKAGLKPEFLQTTKGNKMTMKALNKDDLYYDAMDALEIGDLESAKKFLGQALKLDENYVQTYIGFVGLYGEMGEKELLDANIKIAFEKTQKKFPKWPKEMLWGVIENRAFMRAIQYRADLYSDQKETDKAMELYHLLLKMNPNDNQGVRYVLAGLYAGVSGAEINKMNAEGNKKQNWDKLEKLVEDQNKKHKFWSEPKY